MPSPFYSKFQIVYTLTDINGLVYTDPSLYQSVFIQSLTVVSGVPTISINTTTFAHIGNYNNMLLHASFIGYNPGYSASTNINIQIMNNCNSDTITPNTNTTFYHIVGTS
jgi:alpha-D-ribose 1-methylphosphonate 5-triphosphate synthase subunit PhnH